VFRRRSVNLGRRRLHTERFWLHLHSIRLWVPIDVQPSWALQRLGNSRDRRVLKSKRMSLGMGPPHIKPFHKCHLPSGHGTLEEDCGVHLLALARA